MDAQRVTENLLSRLEPRLQELLNVVKDADPHAYLIGGSLRDLLLERPAQDLDFVSETPAQTLGTALQKKLGGTLVCHDLFLTCTLTLPDLTLDLATAREEVYTRPGALPEVTPGTLSSDLTRRDFSVNTFALSLAEPHTLLSVVGAEEDLKHQTLRILHDRSFFDDPTRIVRGARLAGRLGFRYDDATQDALTDALKAEVYKQVSASRLKNELFLTLAEPQVAPALTFLNASGALNALYGLKDTALITRLDAFKPETVPSESYLLALLLELSPHEAEQVVTTFALPKRLLGSRARLLGNPASGNTEAEKFTNRVLAPYGSEFHSPDPDYRRVNGSDVLSLGLSAGPEVGRVLTRLEEARLDARVASFADELALARRFVDEIFREQA